MDSKIEKIVKKYESNKNRLMDILIDIQKEFGYISKEATKDVAQELDMAIVDVEQTLSFYHFFTQKQAGKNTIYLNNSAVACMKGREEVKKAFEEAAGIKFGHITIDGKIGLYDTACIGMNDQEPAAIINGEIFTNLTPAAAKFIIAGLKSGKDIKKLYHQDVGDGRNGSPELMTMVHNNIRQRGPVLLSEYKPGVVKEKLPSMTATEVIEVVKQSKIQGRGGAGFQTGLKWDFAAKSEGEEKYIICNADEGEPGTFKDRVLLTERPEMMFEGMAIAAYAVGAKKGILYLRYEYKYMEEYLEKILSDAREDNRLGENIAGINGFNFDIRIQFGAGAYVCGEETALIESGEGKRGEPRDKPPFPVVSGYLNMPTVVNNVETLCAVVRIIENGADWYKQFGNDNSTGTKLISVSGDCAKSGVYEVEWGISIDEMLEMVGATDIQAVQVSGPSGQLISKIDFDRKICCCDLSSGGSKIIIGNHRDLLKEVVLNFMEFFVEESCGSCTTCRIIPKLMKDKLVKILDGNGVMQDIDDLKEWSKILPYSRCGLGQTAANPIKTSIDNFIELYKARIQKDVDFDGGFDMEKAVQESCKFVDRVPSVH